MHFCWKHSKMEVYDASQLLSSGRFYISFWRLQSEISHLLRKIGQYQNVIIHDCLLRQNIDRWEQVGQIYEQSYLKEKNLFNDSPFKKNSSIKFD